MSEHEDDVWRDIVENYGDRPQLPDEPRTARRAMPRPEDDPDRWPPVEEASPRDEEAHYVPPPPPPLPRPAGPRLAAWLGLFGAPAVMLVCIVLGVSIPSWIGFLLIVAFVGGFGYLVATMRRDRDGDGWDDGAVV